MNDRPRACTGTVDASQLHEQAALIALLHATTPTCPDVTADVLEGGQPLAVRRDRQDEHEPATLLGRPDTGGLLLSQAAKLAQPQPDAWDLCRANTRS